MDSTVLGQQDETHQDLLFPLIVETTEAGFHVEHKNSIKTQENETLLQSIEGMVGERYQND